MRFLALLCLTLAFPSLTWGDTVYLKPAEALKLVFRESEEIVAGPKVLSADQKEKFKQELGYPPTKDQWNFYLAKTKGKVEGYALIDHEIGKTEPITFMTAILPNGEVKSVEILVYRESHGGEVHESRFLKQYLNKTGSDPLKVGQDIANITGATLSSRAVTKGVKRALILWQIFYGK